MKRAAAHALTRFGLRAGPLDIAPADPRAWLAAQLEGSDLGLAMPRFRALSNGAAALAATQADARERKRLLAARTPLKGHFKSEAFSLFLNDARAELDWAVDTPAPFRERLVWFWANHFTVSIRQGGVLALAGLRRGRAGLARRVSLPHDAAQARPAALGRAVAQRLV